MQSPTTANTTGQPQREYIPWERVGRAVNMIADQLGAHRTASPDTTVFKDTLWNPDLWIYLHRGGAIPAAMIWRAYCQQWRPKTFNLIPISVQSYNMDNEQVGMKIGLKHLGQEGRLTNKDVLIIDDLIDSGASMKAVVESVSRAGARSIKTAVLFSKIGLAADFIGEHVPANVWLDFPWERESTSFV